MLALPAIPAINTTQVSPSPSPDFNQRHILSAVTRTKMISESPTGALLSCTNNPLQIPPKECRAFKPSTEIGSNNVFAAEHPRGFGLELYRRRNSAMVICRNDAADGCYIRSEELGVVFKLGPQPFNSTFSR